jgi:hypothetical protein
MVYTLFAFVAHHWPGAGIPQFTAGGLQLQVCLKDQLSDGANAAGK